jgi:hypothetical protein
MRCPIRHDGPRRASTGLDGPRRPCAPPRLPAAASTRPAVPVPPPASAPRPCCWPCNSADCSPCGGSGGSGGSGWCSWCSVSISCRRTARVAGSEASPVGEPIPLCWRVPSCCAISCRLAPRRTSAGSAPTEASGGVPGTGGTGVGQKGARRAASQRSGPSWCVPCPATRGDAWRRVATRGDAWRRVATRGDAWRRVAEAGGTAGGIDAADHVPSRIPGPRQRGTLLPRRFPARRFPARRFPASRPAGRPRLALPRAGAPSGRTRRPLQDPWRRSAAPASPRTAMQRRTWRWRPRCPHSPGSGCPPPRSGFASDRCAWLGGRCASPLVRIQAHRCPRAAPWRGLRYRPTSQHPVVGGGDLLFATGSLAHERVQLHPIPCLWHSSALL